MQKLYLKNWLQFTYKRNFEVNPSDKQLDMIRTNRNNYRCLVLVFMYFICFIAADTEIKEEVIKAGNNVVDCNIFKANCLSKCARVSWKCYYEWDAAGNLRYIKDRTSCLCIGSNQVLPNSQTPTPTKTLSLNDFRKSVLESHNYYRRIHQAPPLQLNDELNAMAQNWAENIASSQNIRHRPERYGAGENIYYEMMPRNPPTGENAVKSWYNEIKFWDFEVDGDNQFNDPYVFSKVAHFTQLVWKSTSKLGCGRAYNGDYVYVVCNYREAGNIVGNVSKNVKSPA